MVNIDELDNLTEEEDDSFSPEEAAKIRRELNHLAYITREVMIRYYFGGQSVSDIARAEHSAGNSEKQAVCRSKPNEERT